MVGEFVIREISSHKKKADRVKLVRHRDGFSGIKKTIRPWDRFKVIQRWCNQGDKKKVALGHHWQH